jgi:small ligand-binding sensory domain FIST
MTTGPLFGSASVEGGTFAEALDRATDQASAGLAGRAPDVAFVFVSPAYGPDVATAGRRIRERVRARHVVGCTGLGVCETAGEIDGSPALSVLFASLPGVELSTFTLRQDQLLTMTNPDDLRATVGFSASSKPSFVLLADPFTIDADLVLDRLAVAYPAAVAAGGMASGATRPGAHVLYRDGRAPRYGAVGLAIAGLPIRHVVSQGCRPVGRRFVITKCAENKILALSGRPALPTIQEAISQFTPADQELAQTSLLFGRVMHEGKDDFRLGDFLVRNFVGAVPDEGAVLVGDKVRVGQTVQLQLRDGATASHDLDAALARSAADGGPARAALLFSCAGRGKRLFDVPDHDVQAIRRRWGEIPLAGFFCNGEIGAVGPRNFVHGFTASVAVF